MWALGPLPKEPEYGTRQPEVTRAVMEAWSCLEREGMLIPDHTRHGSHSISWRGEALLARFARFEHLEKLGLDRVKHDLLNGGFRWVGGTMEQQKEAWEWVRMKEGQAVSPNRESTIRGAPPDTDVAQFIPPRLDGAASSLRAHRREPHPNPEELLAGKVNVTYETTAKVLGVGKRRIQQLVFEEGSLKRTGTERRPMITTASIREYLKKPDIAQ